MSKASKSRSSEKRRRDKAAQKAAQRARYEAYMRAGQNGKSRRLAIRTSRKRVVRVHDHPLGPCGNIGCPKCNPSAVTGGHRGWLIAQRREAQARALKEAGRAGRQP